MQILYDSDEQIIYYETTDGSRKEIETDFPSKPVMSPDNTKAAYIAPLEWECLGSLYIFDLLIRENKKVITPENNYIPKQVLWLNNELLAVIIGFGHGTIAIGGNVFLYDLTTNSKMNITEYNDKIQVTNFQFEGKTLFLEGIEYKDESYLEFKEFEQALLLEKYL